jgi:hypothetical protein
VEILENCRFSDPIFAEKLAVNFLLLPHTNLELHRQANLLPTIFPEFGMQIQPI